MARLASPCCGALLALASCGRIGFEPSGGSADSSVDAAEGFVDVTTSARGSSGPKPAVVVWTSHRDGSVDDAQLTDAAGKAHLHLDAGGAVSAAYSPAQEFVVASWSIHSIVGAQPGDQLSFGGAPSRCDATSRGTATITYPAYAGASGYRLATRCGVLFAGASPYAWPLTVSDSDPGDVILVAVDNMVRPVASASLFGVALPSGATPTVGAADWHVVTTIDAGVSGLPGAYTLGSVSAQMLLASNDVVATQYAGNLPATGGLVSTTLGAPDVAVRARLKVSATDAARSIGVEIEQVGPVAVTIAPPMPAALSAPAFAPGTRTVTWTAGAGTATADRFETWMSLSNTAGEAISWSVWAPPTATNVVLPQLPSTVTGYDPQAPANQITPIVLLVDFTDLDGWLPARTAPEWDSPRTYDSHPHVATLAAAPGWL